MHKILLAALVIGFAAGANAGVLVINEFVFNHVGTDTHEFIEIFGAPNTDFSNFTVVEIEGDSGQTGLIDDATFTLGTTDANGFWTTGFIPNVPENGTVTLLLVSGYTGAVGNDIDTNDDGVIDTPFWTSIIDDIAVFDGGASDLTYGVTLNPDFDGGAFTVGGASRIPNGADTNSVGDWMRNDFDGEGLPGFSGTPELGEAFNTPGTFNQPVPEPASLAALGLGALALLRRRRKA